MVSFHGKLASLWLLCLFSCVTTAVAEPHTPELPQVTEAPILIQARAELSYWQNWAVIGGTYISSVGELCEGIAAIISAKASAASCATTIIEIKVSKRDDEPVGVEAMSLDLQRDGFNQSGHWVDNQNGNHTFHGFFSNGAIRIDDFYVHGNYTGGKISFATESNSTGLEKRTTWSHSAIAFEYHSHEGVCKTKLTKAQLKEAAKAQLQKMSSNYDKCACWTYTGGHGWYGEVKLMEMFDGDDYSASCYTKACNAT